MKGIEMTKSVEFDRWTTLGKGERLKIVGGDAGGWHVGKSGKFYRTITYEAAATFIKEGSAKEI